MGGVVVAVPTQRLPQQPGRSSTLSPFGVDHSTGERAAVGTAAVRVAGMASAGGVDPSERRGGQGGEQQRVVSHRLWEGLPAGHPSPDQVEHVRRIQAGAGRTLRRPPVPAPDKHHTQRVVGAGKARQHLTRRCVDAVGGPPQPDRSDTVADPGQRVVPCAEVLRYQPGYDQPRHLRRQVVQLQHAAVGAVVVVTPNVVVVGRGAGFQLLEVHGDDHHPCGCAARLVRTRRAAHPVLGVVDYRRPKGRGLRCEGSQPHRDATVQGSVGSQRNK